MRISLLLVTLGSAGRGLVRFSLFGESWSLQSPVDSRMTLLEGLKGCLTGVLISAMEKNGAVADNGDILVVI